MGHSAVGFRAQQTTVSLAAIALLSLLSACLSGDGQGVLIDLRTDLTAGIEFNEVITDIGENVHLQHAVDPNAAYEMGVRVGNEEVAAGTHRIVVHLLRSGREVTAREVLVEVGDNNQVVTVVISRDCRGVMCPSGDDPLLTSCLGGRCVDPQCTPETSEFCPTPDCRTDSECSTAICADPVCADGTCFAVSGLDRCAAGEICEEAGCISIGDCVDRMMSLGETDVDCGGPVCGPCLDGRMCLSEDDCIGLTCAMNRCVSCQDRMLNGDESDVDCGGDFCPPCAPGQMCRSPGDCALDECRDNVCQI